MDEKKPGFIRRSFRGLMKFITFLRLLVVNLFFVVIVIFLISVLSQSKLPEIPQQGALILNIDGTLVDQKSYVDPLARLMGENDPQQLETLLPDVIEAINFARDDERINTIVLRLDDFVYGGISKILEISAALQNFREAGKKVIAIGDNYSQDQYLLAAQADEIYLDPMGAVFIQGYGVFQNYYKSALEKLEINFHVFRVGEFKSAVEPFIRENMSEAAREANQQWLSVLWQQYVDTVASRRNISPEAVETYVNAADTQLAKYAGNTATLAVASGLVDGVKSRAEKNQYLITQVGAEDEDGYYQGVDHRSYLWLKRLEETQPPAANKVGVIVASGMIVDGYQQAGMIGGDSTAELIREARRDEDVQALVLRVDSGGGSAFASEIIRRELQLLQASGKPVVVSMGSVAASGGYWISAAADQIWALPTTITGSIGIFGMFPTFEKTLDKLGIHTDGVGTTKLAGAMRVDRPLSPMAGRIVQSNIEHGYDQFLNIVAEGRDMRRDDVAAIAEGRVWSGVDAKRLGLVDELGGLAQAIDSAAALASLDKYDVETIKLPLTPQEQFLNQLMGGEALGGWLARSDTTPLLGQLARWIAPFRAPLQQLSLMNDPQGMYLHCPVCIAP